MMRAYMAESDRHGEHALRERAYYIWERDGRPEGQADNHWRQAIRDKLVPPVIDSAVELRIDALAMTEPIRDKETDRQEVHCQTER